MSTPAAPEPTSPSPVAIQTGAPVAPPLAPALPPSVEPPPVAPVPAWRWWLTPPRATSTVLIAVAAAGLVAAVALPWSAPGLGWFVTAAGVAAAVPVAVRSVRASAALPAGGRGDRAAAIGWVVVALLLVAVGTVRAAGWLFVLCLAAAIGCGLLAATGARRTRSIVLATLAAPFAALRALPWLSRARAGGATLRTAATVVLTLALLAVFGSLLAGADAVFNRILTTIVPTLDGTSVVRWAFSFVVVGLGTGAAVFLGAAPAPVDRDDRPSPRTWRRLDWALPIGALVVLFAGFVAVQATVLFGGNDHVLTTEGLTYAEYARSGFWQLLVVTVLTLAVVAVASQVAGRRTPADRLFLRVLLGSLTVLVMVVIASALSRMWTYEQVYGFTRLRVMVSAAELWFAIVFGMVLVAGVRLRAAWLPRVVLASAALALLGVAALNPDRFIAERNVNRFYATGRIDVDYLSQLSADAVPELNRLPWRLRDCSLRHVIDRADDQPHGWSAWNLGRAQADPILAAIGTVQYQETCVGLNR